MTDAIKRLGDTFTLTAPTTAAARPARPRRGRKYTRTDHQWILNLCNRHITLSEFNGIRSRVRFFQDYPELLRACVVYFGCVGLGWSQTKAQEHLGMHRDTMTRWIACIEDARQDGDVFDRISMEILGRCNGLL